MTWPHLPALFDLLVEDAILVANPVTVGCQTQGRHGVQETGYGRKKCEGTGSSGNTQTPLRNLVDKIHFFGLLVGL